MKRPYSLLILVVVILHAGVGIQTASQLFKRGDSNLDGTLDLSDAAHTLGYLFLGSTPPPPPFEACVPRDVALADLAVGNYASNDISILLGR